ncbi:hypothetical protein MKW98_018353 [Papaver atlanticum]|uniref:Uncharacterized protein n=1 Tax=Papaver atlanticum TaxID=357466 RepID=A0AAD4XPP3_9MAGN|nr:hypothetical protein MKW98_018353 [Papaver atlanticum]
MSWSCIPDINILKHMKLCGIAIPGSITITEGLTEFPIPEEMTEFLALYQALQHNNELEHICVYCAIREPFELEKQNQCSSMCENNISNSNFRVPEHEPIYGYKPWVPEMSAWISSWFDVSGGTTEDDYEKIIKQHISEVPKIRERKFLIHVCGYHVGKKSGCGAIVRDDLLKPIIAECKMQPKDKRVSLFYQELQGVNLGLELAIHYGVFNFRFYCILAAVDDFVHDCLHYDERRYPPKVFECTCPSRSSDFFVACEACLRLRIPVDQRKYADFILPVIKDIINKVSELHDKGLPYFKYNLTAVAEYNPIGHYVASLGVSKRMTPREIKQDEGLTRLLYDEAVDLHTKFYIMSC